MFKNVNQKTLYKYRVASPKEDLFKIISGGELRFNSGQAFNDPFDTAISYTIDKIDTPLVEQWLRQSTIDFMPDSSKEARDSHIAQRLHEIRTDPDEIRWMRQKQIELNYQEVGICSLAGSNDNLLMWAHYADKHAGVCLGIDVKMLWNAANVLLQQKQVIDLAEVSYSDKMPKVNFFEAMLHKEDANEIMQFLTTKSVHWSYENEHRIIHWGRPSTVIRFGSDIISEIVLGCRMASQERESIIQYCKANHPQLKVMRSEPDESEFKLNIVSL